MDDQRDYAEEEANRRAMEQEGLEELRAEAAQKLIDEGLAIMVVRDGKILAEKDVQERNEALHEQLQEDAEIDQLEQHQADLEEYGRLRERINQHSKILEAIDTWTQRVVSALVDNQPEAFHEYALKHAGLTPEQLEQLGEEVGAEHEDPRYSLYWETLASLSAQVLFEAGKRIRYFR